MTPLPTHLDLPASELRRLVRQLRSVRRAGLDVPHAFGLVADAAALPARLGPPASGPIILLATAADPRQRWRNHFHLAVEAAAASILDDGCGRSSPARTCARLHTLGQVELLAARLADIDAAPTATWVAALSPLLTPASLGWRQPGARLLHDLQRAAKELDS